MSPKTSKGGKGNGIDILDTSVQAASIILSIVQQASQYAPMPYLQQAAKTTLSIIQMVQTVKENKADFRRLGNTCASIIAAVWESYERSPNKEQWPPHELSAGIKDLVETLDNIQDFLEDQLKRPKAIRFIHNMTDRGKISEYRQRLEDAIARFDVSSHLNINDVLYQLLRENKQIKDMLESQKTDASKVLERVDQEDERLRREQLEEEQELKHKEWEREQEMKRREEDRRRDDDRKAEIALQERRKREEEEEVRKAAEDLRRKQAIDEQRRREEQHEEFKRWKAQEATTARTSEITTEDDSEADYVYAEIERLRAKEQEFLEKHPRSQQKRPTKTKKAWVESEDEDGTVLDAESQEDEVSEDEELQSRKAKATAKKPSKRKPKSPPQQLPQPQPQPSPSQADLNAQFARMAMGYSPTPAFAYQPSTPYSPPYPYYSPHSFTPPPVSPGIGYPSPPFPYSPPPLVNNLNSGNVNYSSVSNVGNDYSTNHAPPARKAKRRPKV